MLKGLKGGACTIIGSLPFAAPEKAVEAILSAGLDLPAWPQLPKRCFDELMIPQYAEGLPLFCSDSANRKMWVKSTSSARSDALEKCYESYLSEDPEQFAISREKAAGLHLFLERAAGKKWTWVKGHTTGPLTFTLGINGDEGRPIFYDAELLQVACKTLVRKIEWQIDRLKKLADNVLVFVDEPILSAYGSSAYAGVSKEDVQGLLNEIFAAIKERGATPGVHCCGNTDWSLLTGSLADVINFDAYEFTDSLALYAADVQTFLKRGGMLAWGVVPTSDALTRETPEALALKLKTGVDKFAAKGVSRELLLENMLITPSCGLGSRSEQDALTALSLLGRLSALWKRGQ